MMLTHESNLFEIEIEMKFEVCNLHTFFKATLLLYFITVCSNQEGLNRI